MLTVWAAKVVVLVVLFIVTYAFALLPVKLISIADNAAAPQRRQRFKIVISFTSCFAAGVFLGTCLLDLYPEVEDKINQTMESYQLKTARFGDYPISECVMVLGFFLVLIVEQTVLSIKENHGAHQLTMTRSTERKHHTVTYGAVNDTHNDESADLNGENSRRSRSGSVTSARSISGISDRPILQSGEHSGDTDMSMHQDQSSHSTVRSFIMLAALSVHSVFEGLAVGLEVTVAKVMAIFGALILHKCIIAFSLGLNLVQSKLSFWSIVRSNFIFCLASPLGIGIGITIDANTNQSVSNLVSGILQGLACGTFLYVTFFEVLPHEFNKPYNRMPKLLFVVMGFLVVNGVILMELALTDQ